jgi:hypothetical protein
MSPRRIWTISVTRGSEHGHVPQAVSGGTTSRGEHLSFKIQMRYKQLMRLQDLYYILIIRYCIPLISKVRYCHIQSSLKFGL